jgi:hypothetical protein
LADKIGLVQRLFLQFFPSSKPVTKRRWHG